MRVHANLRTHATASTSTSRCRHRMSTSRNACACKMSRLQRSWRDRSVRSKGHRWGWGINIDQVFDDKIGAPIFHICVTDSNNIWNFYSSKIRPYCLGLSCNGKKSLLHIIQSETFGAQSCKIQPNSCKRNTSLSFASPGTGILFKICTEFRTWWSMTSEKFGAIFLTSQTSKNVCECGIAHISVRKCRSRHYRQSDNAECSALS